MVATAEPLKEAQPLEVEDPREHLMLDPRPRREMNDMVIESMRTASWKYWLVGSILGLIVVSCLLISWYLLIAEGLGIAGVNRPTYWAIFLVNVVYWIGIAHSGTFTSALLRVMKADFRRPFTRAAELMTTFALINVGFSVLMHMGRPWLAYWMLPYPNGRTIWPDFHSPLGWDFLAITAYLVCSTLYLYLPLIPDLAMLRDHTAGIRKFFYRLLAVGFRGTEAEWVHLHTAMNIFAWAFIPLMFSVSTTIAWDFAAAIRPGWSSTIFGPYFVVGAIHSGIAAVGMVLVLVRSTMKNMKYFIRPEHLDIIGKLILVVSVLWAYFYFNDYLVQWYGGDKFTSMLLEFHEKGAMGWMWFALLIFNAVIPWLTLWNKKVRRNPAMLFTIGLMINVGMWFERYIIVPVTLTINRMPFTWKLYKPGIEIPLTIGTFALFLLLYMIASRVLPIIPVWEVQEGQIAHSIRKVGKAEVKTVSDIE
jgi:Ni/Fe-hydrogenase subunit HybB-like protein